MGLIFYLETWSSVQIFYNRKAISSDWFHLKIPLISRWLGPTSIQDLPIFSKNVCFIFFSLQTIVSGSITSDCWSEWKMMLNLVLDSQPSWRCGMQNGSDLRWVTILGEALTDKLTFHDSLATSTYISIVLCLLTLIKHLSIGIYILSNRLNCLIIMNDLC